MIVVLTADDGNVEEFASITRENKRQYAAKHGYTFIHYHLKPNELSVYWNLVRAIRDCLSEHCEEGYWLFFTGADACVINTDYSLREIVFEYTTSWERDLQEGHRRARVRYPTDPDWPEPSLLITRDANGLNNNGFLLRNNEWGRTFIEKVWARRGHTFNINGHEWSEQGAMIKVLEEPGMLRHLYWLPQELTNGYDPRVYGSEYKEPLFVSHYPGKKTEERTYFIKRALGLVPSVEIPQAHWIDNEGKVRPPQ